LSLRARVTESRQEPRAKVECPASTSKQRLVVPAFSTDLGLNAWGKCIVSGPQVMGRSQTVFSEDLSSRHRRSQEHKAALCPQAVPPHRHVLSTRVGNKNKSGVPWISRSLTTPTPTVGREAAAAAAAARDSDRDIMMLKFRSRRAAFYQSLPVKCGKA
jgi:hypothetical protein